MTADLCRKILYQNFAPALFALVAASLLAHAQTPPPAGQNPVCARLEGQFAAFERGGGDGGRAEQIKRLEETANKQQFELDRLNAQSRRAGCEGTGFFLFGGQPPQCGPLNAQIQQARTNLDRTQTDIARLQNMGSNRDDQRRAILVALAQNDCGPQYRAAAASLPPPQPRGFLDTLLGSIPIFGNNPTPGNNSIFGLPDLTQSSTYRTLCVRTCDGYYFPISFSTTQDRVKDDERTCQRACPAADVALYSHRNPGEEVAQAVSLNGRLYTELPNAFRYRQEYSSTCSCRKPGESWAQALKNLDDRSTLERGDILVNEEQAKQLSQPKIDAKGRPIKPDPKAALTAAPPAPFTLAPSEPPAESNSKRPVRSVGPTFYPVR